MHKAFAGIKIGPLKTRYHRRSVDDTFRAALSNFLEERLLPQVDEPYTTTKGKLKPCFNEEKYCGPNSAVRDRYEFKFSFIRDSGEDALEAKLLWYAETKIFEVHPNRQPLILWTARRQKCVREFREKVENLIKEILHGRKKEVIVHVANQR
ncbi:MAG: hypothetical protein AAGK14_05030 [Verrucomicrobiota bacterium]